jgi:hypothetical protein
MMRPSQAKWVVRGSAASAPLAAVALFGWLVTASAQSGAGSADYCRIETAGAGVELVRPRPGDRLSTIDDVNWFARPVPNMLGRRIVAYASHNLNYLYDLTTGARIRIPDQSDAVATPDGRYMTVPSHYTSTKTVNFYDLPTLLDRLESGRDAADVAPIFAHRDPDVEDVYYQSVGVVSQRREGDDEVTVYRMMFSGARHPEPPGFRVVDYEIRRRGDRIVVTPSKPMRLCPQIVKDMATPFISKDGRYVAAHDEASPTRASLKIFEITGTDPERRTTACEQRVDFGFAAGKADFSFDGSMLTFHISKHNYLTVFVDGGIAAPTITDVVVVDLMRDAKGGIVGYGGMSRVTTSAVEGVGSYFPAFFPDGRVLYISNAVPKNRNEPKRYRFTVVDPSNEVRMANHFADPVQRVRAAAIGDLWRVTCAPAMEPFKPGEAEWQFMSLSAERCRALVSSHWSSSVPRKEELLEMCVRSGPGGSR